MDFQQPDFQTYQREFAAHIRDPRHVKRPRGVPARRMKVYSDLLRNNLEGFLLSCFPVCRKILGKRRWDRLVSAFFRDHACHTPFFRQIPEEFLKYLQDGYSPAESPQSEGLPEFLPELAHYEWVELELDTSDRDARGVDDVSKDGFTHDSSGDPLAGRLIFNPVLRVLAYRWPVHRLSPRFKPTQPPAEATFMLAFRDAEFHVRFILLNAASARLLTLLQENPDLTGHQVMSRLALEVGMPSDALENFARPLVQDLLVQGALIGLSIRGAGSGLGKKSSG
jgi:uncharacterized protein